MALEDKWFDFLDALDAKGIPVYSIVDPLEKRGIPSMPVALVGVAAVICLIVFVVLPMLTGGGGGPVAGGKYTLTLTIKDNATGNPIQGVAITAMDGKEYNGTTDKDGKWSAEVTGDKYAFTLTKESCDVVKLNRTIGKDTSISVSLKCAAVVAKPVTICFEPRTGIGTVNAIVEQNGVQRKTITNCGSNGCTLLAESGYSYYFETSAGYISKSYDAGAIIASEGMTCVPLQRADPDGPASEKGRVMVRLELDSKPITGATVRLVNPLDSAGIIEAETTLTEGVDAGIAYFEQPVGTTFRVLIPAGTGISYYLGHYNYSFSDSLQEIPISFKTEAGNKLTVNEGDFTTTIELGAPTTITVTESVEGTSAPLPSVSVNAFKSDGEQVSGPEQSDADGKVVFSLTRGAPYRVAFFKEGYSYKEETITGGENKAVVLSKVDREQVGDIAVHVMIKNTEYPVAGATLLLKKGADTQWYGSPVTDENGNAAFSGVTPGKYCISVSRAAGLPSPCSENQVTVVANNVTPINVTVKPLEFTLNVSVRLEGKGVTGAAAIAMDDFSNKEVVRGSTVNGTTLLRVPELTKIRVDVTYNAGIPYNDTQTLGTVSQDKNITFVLTPLDTNITFLYAKDGGTEIDDLASHPLQAGKSYTFVFSLGLPRVQGQKWDEVRAYFELPDSTKDWFEIYPMDGATWNGEKWRISENAQIDEPSLPGSSETLRISGDYDDAIPKMTIELPVRIKYAFNATKDYQLNYRAEWVKANVASVKDNRDGGAKSVPFKLTMGSCKKSPDSTWGVCLYVVDGDTKVSPENFVLAVDDTATLEVDLINEQPGTRGKHTIMLAPAKKYETVLFSDAMATIYRSDDTERLPLSLGITPDDDYTFSDKTINITLDSDKFPVIDESDRELLPELRHSERLAVAFDAKAIGRKLASIEIFSNKQKIADFSFKLSGAVNGTLNVAPTPLFDLTGQIKVNLTEASTGTPVAPSKITDARIVGDGLTGGGCNGGIDLKTMGFTDSKEPYTMFYNFSSACKLKPGGTIEFCIQSEVTKDIGDYSDRCYKGGGGVPYYVREAEMPVGGEASTETPKAAEPAQTKTLAVDNCIVAPITTNDLLKWKDNEQPCVITVSPVSTSPSYMVPDYCSVSAPALMTVQIKPDCKKQGITEKNLRIKSVEIPSDFPAAASNTKTAINITYTGQLGPRMPTDDSTLTVKTTAEKGALHSDQTMNLGVRVDFARLIADGYTPLPVQRYGENTLEGGGCGMKYCNLELAMAYVANQSSNFAPSSDATVPFKLMDQGDITSPDVATYMSKHTKMQVRMDSDVKTQDDLPASFDNGDVFLSPENVEMPRAGLNNAVIYAREYSGKKYYFVTFEKTSDDALTIGAADRINVFMPAQTPGVDGNKPVMNTEITMGKGIADADKEEIKNATGDMLKNEFNLTNRYASMSGAVNKLVIAVCDNTDFKSGSPCDRLKTMTKDETTGDWLRIPIIYRNAAEKTTYFIGTNVSEVKALISALDTTLKDPKIVTLVKRNIDVGNLKAGYLTLKPSTVFYDCIKPGAECDENDVTSIEPLLKEIYANLTGKKASEVKAFMTYDNPDYIVAICANKAGCGEPAPSASADYLAAFDDKLSNGMLPSLDIPVGGIYFRNETKEYAFGPDVPTIEKLLKVRIGNATGTANPTLSAGAITVKYAQINTDVWGGYSDMPMLNLSTFLNNSGNTSAESFIVNATENPSKCYIDLTPTRTFDLDSGDSVLLRDNGTTYLFTAAKEGGTWTMHGTALKVVAEQNTAIQTASVSNTEDCVDEKKNWDTCRFENPEWRTQCRQFYDLYVQCTQSLKAGDAPSPISGLVCDQTPPAIKDKTVKGKPSGSIVSGTIDVRVDTDERANCRWSKTDTEWGKMANNFVTADYKSHTADMTSAATEGVATTVHILCQDFNGNTMASVEDINFTLNNPPTVSLRVSDSWGVSPFTATLSASVSDPTPSDTEFNYTLYFDKALNSSQKVTGTIKAKETFVELANYTYFQLSAGSHKVYIRVNDSIGNEGTSEGTISVTPSPLYGNHALIAYIWQTQNDASKDHLSYATYDGSTRTTNGPTTVDNSGTTFGISDYIVPSAIASAPFSYDDDGPISDVFVVYQAQISNNDGQDAVLYRIAQNGNLGSVNTLTDYTGAGGPKIKIEDGGFSAAAAPFDINRNGAPESVLAAFIYQDPDGTKDHIAYAEYSKSTGMCPVHNLADIHVPDGEGYVTASPVDQDGDGSFEAVFIAYIYDTGTSSKDEALSWALYKSGGGTCGGQIIKGPTTAQSRSSNDFSIWDYRGSMASAPFDSDSDGTLDSVLLLSMHQFGESDDTKTAFDYAVYDGYNEALGSPTIFAGKDRSSAVACRGEGVVAAAPIDVDGKGYLNGVVILLTVQTVSGCGYDYVEYYQYDANGKYASGSNSIDYGTPSGGSFELFEGETALAAAPLAYYAGTDVNAALVAYMWASRGSNTYDYISDAVLLEKAGWPSSMGGDTIDYYTNNFGTSSFEVAMTASPYYVGGVAATKSAGEEVSMAGLATAIWSAGFSSGSYQLNKEYPVKINGKECLTVTDSAFCVGDSAANCLKNFRSYIGNWKAAPGDDCDLSGTQKDIGNCYVGSSSREVEKVSAEQVWGTDKDICTEESGYWKPSTAITWCIDRVDGPEPRIDLGWTGKVSVTYESYETSGEYALAKIKTTPC
jgi:hypothetical protein